MQRLVHLLRREEKIGTAVGGHEEPVSVGMPLDRARDEIELGDDAKLTFAIGHELAVALHRGKPACECIALGGTAHAECSRNIIGVHRRAAVTQLFENLVAARNVDVVATAVRRAPHLSRRHVNIFLRLFL